MAEREVHLRDYLAVIRKHDFIIIVSFLLVFGAALIVSLYMPRMYEATAIIEIQPSSKPAGLPSLMQSVMSSGVDQVSMETISRRFTSRPVLTEAIRNLKRAMPEIAHSLIAPETLASRIRTDIVSDTRMLEVTVRMRRDEGGSEWAVRIANELVAVVQAHRSAKTDAKMRKRRDFINDKMGDAGSQINDSDQGIREFLKDGGGPLVWDAQSRHIMTRLADLMKLREENKALMAAEQKKLHELEAKLESEPEWLETSRTFSRDILLDKYRTELVDLRKELVAARIGSGERNPRVEMLEAQISEIEREMKNVAMEATSPSARTESRSATYQTMLNQRIETELNMIAYRAQLEIAENMLGELNDRIDRMFSEMPEKQFQLEKMKREVEYKVDTYKSLLEKELEAEIWAIENSDDSPGKIKGGIEIVDTAQPKGSPVSPRIKFIGAIAGLVGLVIGLAMAFLAEYFENIYQSPEEAMEAQDGGA